MATLDRRVLQPGAAPALLVVDACTGFTDPACPLGSEVGAELAVIARLMAHAHAARWPVVLSRVIYHDDGEAPVFRARLPALDLLAADGPWTAIDPRLAPAADDLILDKQYASCFFATDLGAWLQARGVDTLYVTGFTTSGCVRASAVDALQHDLRTFVIEDAVADRDAAAHRANLHDLAAKYAEVIRSSALLDP
ncbi:MAG TPA: isochorismatase family protein [Pseudomonadales bacterium]|nr:isochorismatase family protein [Pseudomonadales bacterium]